MCPKEIIIVVSKCLAINIFYLRISHIYKDFFKPKNQVHVLSNQKEMNIDSYSPHIQKYTPDGLKMKTKNKEPLAGSAGGT